MSFTTLLYGRRLKSTLAVMAAQLLLFASALALCIQLVFIARYGEVLFKELNRIILWGEIIGTLLISIFAAVVFINQWKRMGEKRRSDDRN
jgi:phosphatidylglycerophosphatase A